MSGHMSSIRSLCPGRQAWKIKARVIRRWEMAPAAEPCKPYALQLVLIDSEGSKIEVTIKKYLISKFQRDVVEGNVYKFTYFVVIDNNGSYRAADHEYKILFNSRTKVQVDQCESIPRMGLTLKDTAEIHMTMGESDFLIDIIGLVTAVSAEQQFTKSGNVTRKIELEITDHKGKIKMALFGNYVDIVQGFLAVGGVGLAVIVVQFAKIKTYRGDVGIQNVMQATRLLWNAEIPEVALFRDGLALNGIDADIPIGHIGGAFPNIPANEEFISMFPTKSIVELHDTAEDGLFIVLANFSGLVEGEKWWYTACRCHKAVNIEDGIYYCAACCSPVLDVIPRYRIKLEVCDGDEVATFVLFDTDCQHVIKKSCKELVLSSKGKSVDEFPDDIKSIIGKEVLFKVEKSIDHGMKFDDSYKVKKICDDLSIIELFKDKAKIQTPTTQIADLFAAKSASEENSSLFSEQSIGCSSELSAVDDTSVSLDDLSPFEGASVCSIAEEPESHAPTLTKPGRKRKLVSVKTEK